jgi:TPP-dependent pyruvate/acetoin dehydrogenase alpha subunit
MEKVTATTELFRRGEVYGIPSRRIDGNDCFAVHAAASEAVTRARGGGGPSLVEAVTYRWREHAEGLEILFSGLREVAEIDAWMSRDPVPRHEALLREHGVAASTIDELNEMIAGEVESAVEFARNSAEPPPEEALTDLWASAADQVQDPEGVVA